MSTTTNVISFNVTSKTVNGAQVYQAVATIPGLAPTVVEKIEGGNTFSTRSSVTSACNNRAALFGMKPLIKYSVAATTTTSSAIRSSKNTVQKTRSTAR